MQKTPSNNSLEKFNPPTIKIFDNSTEKKSRTKFVKYVDINKYYEDAYSSDEDDESLNPTHELTGPKLNLTELARQITSLDDVIKLCDIPLRNFSSNNQTDLLRLKKIKQPLIELNRLIGMSDLKNKIIYQALYYCQDLHKIKPIDGNEDEGDLMHTVIQGPPGSGKTTVAKIIGKIYARLGVLKSDKFIIAKRKDLIGEYLGQTAPRTTAVLESALNGVLFLDEAYSLGNEEKRDIYSKECIDTINQYLTEHKRDIVVIIAGYQENLKSCFFALNPGLERRFPWVYNIEKYNEKELRDILIKQITESGWGFADNDLEKALPLGFIKENMEFFNYAGGDTETFLNKCKLAHSQNTFGLASHQKGKLTYGDFIKGLEMHKTSKLNNKSNENSPPPFMYV